MSELSVQLSVQQNIMGFVAGFSIPIVVAEGLNNKGSVLPKMGLLSVMGALSMTSFIPLSAKIGGIIAGSFLSAEMVRDMLWQNKGQHTLYRKITTRAFYAAIIGSVNGIAAKALGWSSPSAFAVSIVMSGIATAVLSPKTALR